MSEVVVKDETFEEEVLKADVPVLVDFWAEWCGPCRMLSPQVEKIASEYEGKVKVVKVNVDECPQSASQYQIQSIPTLMTFHKGETVARNIGAVPKETIVEMFSSLI